MSFTDPGHVADVLDGILTALSDALTAAGRPIDRVFRSPGPAPWDCGQLTAWGGVRVVSPGTRTDPNPMRSPFVLALDVSIQLSRCLASARVQGVPSAAQVDGDGVGAASDLWIITKTLTQGVHAATLGVPDGCAVARVNPVTTPPPSGGYYAVTTSMEVVLG